MARKSQSIENKNEFIEALKILASKLDKREYDEVAGVMFRTYMGQKFGYLEVYDPQILADIKACWLHRRPKNKNTGKLVKFKLIKGSKDGSK